jgi:crotonobetainyl-CoA:carnitine CoA-transferase CaiB-like acyl-CoA transferase
MTAGLAAFAGVLLALQARERTGRGQRVDANLLRAAVALQPFQLVPPARGERSVPAETLAGTVPCYRVYRTKDGRAVALGALEPQFWETFCDLTGNTDWLSRAHDPELIPEVEALFRGRARDEWRLLEGAECCLSAVLTPEEVAQDPQVMAQGLILSGRDGRPARVAPPVTLEDTPPRPEGRVPARPGQDTDEVLRRHLGLEPDQVRSLRERGAVF